MTFREKSVNVEAIQWFKNGDHPDDGDKGEGKIVRYFNHPVIKDNTACGKCGNWMKEHGWIDTLHNGQIICPGDWIITDEQGNYFPVMSTVFKIIYEPLDN